MPTDELAPLIEIDWPKHDHRFALARLEHLGWTACGRGDWAYVLRSPSGRSAARVAPFEHGYELFVALCERCAGNSYLPRIELASRLEGGGHLTVLEYLTSSTPPTAEDFLRRWHDGDTADPELTTLRRAVDAVDRWGRNEIRGWVGVDLGPRHVLLAADGRPKIIDLFGADLINLLIADPADFARRIPADQRRHLLDVPDLHTDHPESYLDRVRAAFAALDADPAQGA